MLTHHKFNTNKESQHLTAALHTSLLNKQLKCEEQKNLLTEVQDKHLIPKDSSQENSVPSLPRNIKAITKWGSIFLVSFLTLGPFIMSYGVGCVKQSFKELFQIDDKQYNYMQSGVTLVASAVTFFGGFIADSIGLRSSLVVFSTGCILGYIVQFFGIYTVCFTLQIAGQAIGYSFLNLLMAIQGPLIRRWADSKEYSVSASLTFLSVRLGDVIAAWIFPLIEESSGGIYLAFLFGLLTLSLLLSTGSFCAYHMDKRAEASISCGDTEDQKKGEMRLAWIKEMKPAYWMIVASGMCGIGCFYSFYFNSQTILREIYEIDRVTAGRIYSIPFLVSFLQPIFAILMDYTQKQSALLCITSLFNVAAFSFWIAFSNCIGSSCYFVVIPSYILLGFFLSTFLTVIWHSILLLSPKRLQSTAFAMFYTAKNLAIASFSIGTGYLLDSGSLDGVLLYTLGIAVLSTLFAFSNYIIQLQKQQQQGIESTTSE